jgi:mannose-6-phosphate isomerase-like protein (cupin superfamily)
MIGGLPVGRQGDYRGGGAKGGEMSGGRVTVKDALEKIPGHGLAFATVFKHKSLEVEIYAPRGEDLQTPHARNECYVVLSGSGWFVNGEERYEFGPGDFLFVPAGVHHRFEEFTDDFATWVFFYGPEGGE